MINHKTCVQLGIMDTAEYLYLTSDDWKLESERQSVECRIPPSVLHNISDEAWHYYGVDYYGPLLGAVADRYKDNARSKWIVAFLSGNPLDTIRWLPVNGLEPSYGRHHDPSKGQYSYCMASISLSQLFRFAGIDSVELLTMDIEGSEYLLLKHHDWHIRPAMIFVEVHAYHDYTDYEYETKIHPENVGEMLELNCSRLESFMRGMNYDVIFKQPTSIGTEYPTIEVKFINKECTWLNASSY